MPKRMLRDWTDSEPVNSLDWRDEVFFTRLIMKADDFGRFSANPKLLRSLLFPFKDGLRDTDMTRALVACRDAGLIRLYTSAQGKPLLEIVNFGQRMDKRVAKYPGPEEDGSTPDIIPENPGSSGKFPPERKGSRKEEEVEGPGKARAKTCDELKAYCLELGLPASDAIYLWEKWESTGWVNGGRPIKDWKGTIRTWKAGGYLPSQKRGGNSHNAPAPRQLVQGTPEWIFEHDNPEGLSLNEIKDRLRRKS